MASATERLKARFDAMKSDGLVDVRFTFSPEIQEFLSRRFLEAGYVAPVSLRMPTVEEFSGEVLEMLDAVAEGRFQEFKFNDSVRKPAVSC